MSIPLHSPAFRLPDFRNLGIWLRVMLAANVLLLIGALIRNDLPAQWPHEVAGLAAVVEPALLLLLTLLFLLSPWLQRLPPPLAGTAVILLAMAIMAGTDMLLARALGQGSDWRLPAAAGGGAAGLLSWFDLRAKAHAPALAEARLAALTARIRPHFFFNSLNAVLGVIRAEPRRAEAALEELAELFRALMRENRDLVPLTEELALARKYLDIERLRLGERLQVSWAVDDFPAETLAPPLLLQPLLENAVYHGIEPAATPGEIGVRITTGADEIRIEIDNPWCGDVADKRQGNRMALDNLRERLMLFYDLEARLDTRVTAGHHRVCVILPRRGPRP